MEQSKLLSGRAVALSQNLVLYRAGVASADGATARLNSETFEVR